MDKADWAILGKGKFILTAIIMVAVLALPSFIYTGSYIIADAPADYCSLFLMVELEI